jgi:hypothetical protein
LRIEMFAARTGRFFAGLMTCMIVVLAVAMGSPAHAQTSINDSVLLDPFSPVPQIQFSPGYEECGDGCYHHCWHDCRVAYRCDDDCRYGGWHCGHGCRDGWRPREWRDCDHDCHYGSWDCDRGCRGAYGDRADYGPPRLRYPDAPPTTLGERVERNDYQADRNDFMTERWKAQSDWYQHNVIDRDCDIACDDDHDCQRDCHHR